MDARLQQIAPRYGNCGEHASLLIDVLKGGAIGDVKTDEDLKRICGRDVTARSGHAGILYSAIRYCVREYKVVWERERGAGCIRCIDHARIRERVKAHARHVHRTGKRRLHEMHAVDLNALSEDTRRLHLLAAAHLGTLIMVSDGTTRKKLEARGVQQPLRIDKLLEALKD